MNLGDNSQSTADQRGTSEVVGIILLFGMVLAGAAIVFVAGGSLIDSLEQQTESEQVETEFDVTADQLHRAISSGDTQALAETSADRRLERETTTVSFERVNASESSNWKAGETYEEQLNALVYETDGQRYVFEGGGQWRVVEGNTVVHTPPQFEIGFDETVDQLIINLVNIDPDSSISDGEMIAEPSAGDAVDEAALENAITAGDPANAKVGNDLRVEIDSEHATAWEQYLRDSSNIAVTDDRFDITWASDHPEDKTVLLIEDVLDEMQPAFEITDVDAPEQIEHDDELETTVTVENVGTAAGDAQVEGAIPSEPTTTTATQELDPGETHEFKVELDPQDHPDVESSFPSSVDQYNEYTLELGAVDADTGVIHSEHNRTFFLTHPKQFFRIETHNYDAGTITLDLTNIASEAAIQDIAFELEGESTDGTISIDEARSFDAEIDPWNDATVEIPINRSRLPTGQFDYTVDLSDNNNNVDEGNHPGTCNSAPPACKVNGSFELTEEGNVSADPGELVSEEPTNATASILGTEISAEGDIYPWLPDQERPFPLVPDEAFLFIDEDGNILIDQNGDVVEPPEGTIEQEPDGGLDYQNPWVGSESAAEPEWDDSGGWRTDGELEIEEKSPGWCVWDWCTEYRFTFDGATEFWWDEDGGYDIDWTEEPGGEWEYGPGEARWFDFDRGKSWGAVTATATVGDEEIRFTPQSDSDWVPLEDAQEGTASHNLNTFGTQETVWEYEATDVEGTISVSTTYWSCEEHQLTGVDTSSASNPGDNEETYGHVECADFGESVATAEGGSGSADAENGFVMTRSENRSALPDIEPGYPRQRSVNEVFEDGTESVKVDENDNLTLGSNEFAFMMESTMSLEELENEYKGNLSGSPSTDEYDSIDVDSWDDWWDRADENRTAMNTLSWEIAQGYRDSAENDTGDPNFNDVIGYIELNPGETEFVGGDPLHQDPVIDGDPREVDVEESDVDAPSGGGGIEIGVGEISIG